LKLLAYRPVDFAWMAVIALLYLALAKFALAYLSIRDVAILWPSSGLALAALLMGGMRLWPGVMLGALAAEYSTGFSASGIALAALGNSVEPVIGVWLLSRFGFNKALPKLRDYFLFLFLAAVGSTSVSAVLGAAGTCLSSLAGMETLAASFFRWWMGNMLGVLLAVPLLVFCSCKNWLPIRQVYEAFLLLILTLLFCAVAFDDFLAGFLGDEVRAYWVFPLIIWAAVRFGTGGVSFILLTIQVLSFWGLMQGTGYFGHDMGQTGLINFWFYHVIIHLTGMSLATSLNEGHAGSAILEHERQLLRDSEKRLREYLEFSPIPLGISEIVSKKIIFLNHAFTDLFGYTLADVPDLDTWFCKAYPDPIYRQEIIEAWRVVMETNKSKSASSPFHEVRIVCKNHSERNVELVVGPPGDYLLVAFNDITQKRRDKEVIWRQAHYDALTELPNRRLFLDRLRAGMEQSSREQRDLALLLIDLDRFKEVNDTYGHDVGDLLLVNVAQRIVSCVGKNDTVARLGGDEFTVVLPSVERLAEVDSIAQAIVNTLAQPFQLGHEQVFVSASIGITRYPEDGRDVKTLLKNADQALFEIKDLGRNSYSYFTQALHEAAQKRLLMIRDLRVALTTGQLVVHYQPIIDLRNGAIAKAEALLHWQHPTQGLISPGQFIALAEDIGLICEVGDWVFHQAALQAKHLRDHGHFIQISVNKSVRQFITGNSQEAWVKFLGEIGLPGECIAIEITENLLLDDRPELLTKLRRFREAGIQLSIDDFGTGYSSLSYLKKFDIDFLKIDQSFVRDLTNDPSELALAEAIIVMAHKLGLKVIAEGVETPLQRDILTTSHCDYAQGFWYSNALSREKFDAFLASWQGEPEIASDSEGKL